VDCDQCRRRQAIIGQSQCLPVIAYHFNYKIVKLTVPVASTSPGMRVWPSDMVFNRYGMLKIKSSVVAF
jgi:hypothetical protein